MSRLDFIRPATRVSLLPERLPAEAVTIFAALLVAFAVFVDLPREALAPLAGLLDLAATLTGLLAGAPSILADFTTGVLSALADLSPEAFSILVVTGADLTGLSSFAATLSELPPEALTLTRAVPEPSMPRTEAAALDTSMIRP